MNLKLKIAKITSFIPDKIYLSMIYWIRMRKKLNWENPQTFSEKMQWMKIYDRNPLYIQLVDKYEMKKYVDSIIGEGHTIHTLGIWDNVDDIDFSKLPNKFVIKGTHDSGSAIVCLDKSKLDIKKTKKVLQESLNSNLYYLSREWPYKNVPHRIIAEEFLEPKDDQPLTEYKVFCFDGEVKMVLVCKGKAHSNERTNDFCDPELKRFPFTTLLPNSKEELKKPNGYEKLLKYASQLSENLPEVRVDAYVFDGNIYFGELTFFHNSGLRRFEPDDWDYKLGSWVKLRARQEKGE